MSGGRRAHRTRRATSATLVDSLPDCRGRTVLVTGANSGIGLRTAEVLTRLGARVLLACRSEQRGRSALAHIGELATDGDPALVPLDLADLASVRRAAAFVEETTDRLDVVVNNAGVMALPFGRTADGFEIHFGVNHLGHFALTGLLLPLLRATPAARVVTVSSLGHRLGRLRLDDLDWSERRYRRFTAYTQSKLANVAFMLELGRRARLAGSDIQSVGAHPGYTDTHLQTSWLRESPTARSVMNVANRLAQEDGMGALPSLYAAVAPGVASGNYFGPRFLEVRGAPRLVTTARRAHDPDARRRLWEISERLTGVVYEW